MPKKKSEKPKLIVLVKGSPEEMVLTACKMHGVFGPITAETCIVEGAGWCSYLAAS